MNAPPPGGTGWPPARSMRVITESPVPRSATVTRWFTAPQQPRPAGAPAAGMPDDEVFRAAVREVLRALVEGDPQGSRAHVRALIEAEVRQRAEDPSSGYLFPVQAEKQLVQAVFDELYGLGPLQPYLEDPGVENIDINGCDRVIISYSDGRRERGPAVAADDQELIEKVRLWSRAGNTPREFSQANPLLNTAMEDLAGVRLAASMSVSARPYVSIRCHRLVDVTLDDLVANGTLDVGLRAFLAAAIRARLSVVITGGTNAGKTTLLRALTAEIDPMERIATLETDFEMFLHWLPERHTDVVAFEARQANSEGAGEITLNALIPQALRHNPRRIIVGEVRSTEALPMLEAMQSGHEGSLCTIHANHARDAFNRILTLALRAGLDMPTHTVHLMVGMSIDLVVHLRRDAVTGQRYVSEVLEVMPPADTERPATNDVYLPGPDGRAVPAHTPHNLEALVAAGFDPALLDRGGPWRTGQRS